MDTSFETLIEYISSQLSPEILCELLNNCIHQSLKPYIDDYIKREVSNSIIGILNSEIERIKFQISNFISETSSFLSSFYSQERPSPTPNQIQELLSIRDFAGAFGQFLKLPLNEQGIYFPYFEPLDLTDYSLNEDLSVPMAIWSVDNKKPEFLGKLISIIPKGDGLSSILRKIVASKDPIFQAHKALIIKKSV